MSHDGNERLLQGLYESCKKFLHKQYPSLTDEELEDAARRNMDFALKDITEKIDRARLREYE